MGMTAPVMTASVIIPFHRDLAQLGPCLSAVRRSVPDAEIIVAADGAQEDCRALVAAHGARLVVVDGPVGPATARNRAAVVASGDVLVFVDADVVVAPDAVPVLLARLRSDAALAGVFGAYDLRPAAPNFMSQYRNLSHARIHELGEGEATTFWAGLGAMRTRVFHEVGGFDERFGRPSVEDIDLGYRVTARGHRLRLDPAARGCHLKRWTLVSGVSTDIFARGIPWVQLIRRHGRPQNQLNLTIALRLSVVCAYLLLLAPVMAMVAWWGAVLGVVALAVLLALNASYYRWFARQRGVAFAIRVVPAHVLHHWCNGVSWVAGSVLHLLARGGWRLPGAVPAGDWSAARRAGA
jgi:GT2 family glycosyltransferase